jgi:3-oxoacyl-[acyl-carrier-protein] synthase II
MSRRRVAVTGLGLVSSLGRDPTTVFDAWCDGRSGIANHVIGEGEHTVSVPYGVCAEFDGAAVLGKARANTMDRASQLSVVAATDAWADAGLAAVSAECRDALPVHWGTGGGGVQTTERSYRDLFLRQRGRLSPLSVVLGMHNGAASQIALQLGLGAECLTYSVACASSTIAIGEAFRRVRAGDAAVALAGGAEAAMPYGALKAWEALQVLAPAGADPAAACKPFDAERRGLVLAEGAAALILEEWDRAVGRGARIYAEVLGYGGSCDHAHLTAPGLAGQVRALQSALQDAGLQPGAVDHVNAHATGTLEGDVVEAQALSQVLGAQADRAWVSATKSLHGHCLGAAGAIEALVTSLALHRQRIPPSRNLDRLDPRCAAVRHASPPPPTPSLRIALMNSFAFGGSNAVLVLGAHVRPGA